MPIPVVKQINDLLWHFHRRGERRWLERKVESWSVERTRGRSRYVRRVAVRWGATQWGVMFSLGYLGSGRASLWFAAAALPLSLAMGWWAGADAWAENERLYEKARQAATEAASSAREAQRPQAPDRRHDGSSCKSIARGGG